MSDEKTKFTESPKPNEQTPAFWAMPFQEMFEEMMKRCGCRPEQMGDMWSTCCGQPREMQKKPGHNPHRTEVTYAYTCPGGQCHGIPNVLD